MIYLMNKTQYEAIAMEFHTRDLKGTTLEKAMIKYVNDGLCLPEGTIIEIKTK